MGIGFILAIGVVQRKHMCIYIYIYSTQYAWGSLFTASNLLFGGEEWPSQDRLGMKVKGRKPFSWRAWNFHAKKPLVLLIGRGLGLALWHYGSHLH